MDSKVVRGFKGPFYVIGVVPAWPKELERRAGQKTGWTPADQLAREMARVQGTPAWLAARAKRVSPELAARVRKALAKPATAGQIARRTRLSPPTVKAALVRLGARQDAGGKYALKH